MPNATNQRNANKTTMMRYHLTTVRFIYWPSSINQQITSAGEDVEKRGILVHWWWEYRLAEAAVENNMELPPNN